MPGLTPVRDSEELDRAGYAVFGSAPGLYPVMEWGRVSPELRAFAARRSIYDPVSGDPLLDTQGALYPGFDNWYGMVAAGRRPGHLIRALTDRRFDAVAPFDEGKWSEDFASGRGRFEANFVQKLNRVIEAKYARSASVPEGFLARRPGPDPAPWMGRCFGPFPLAGASFSINRGGGFWCRERELLTLRETRAAYSDVRSVETVASARGELSIAIPRAGGFNASLEPDGEAPLRLLGERLRDGRLTLSALRGDRRVGEWAVDAASPVALRFDGELGRTPIELRAGGRRLGSLPVEGLDGGAVLRLGGSRGSRVSYDLRGLELG